MKIFKTIKKLLPKDIVEYCTVISSSDGKSLVENPSGVRFYVYGESSSSAVWVSDGKVLSDATDSLSSYSIII